MELHFDPRSVPKRRLQILYDQNTLQISMCFQPGLSSSPWKAAKPLDTKDKFCPEPLAHQAVNIKVEAGVEDNEDMVEVSHTEPEAWDGMPASLVADRHSEIRSVKQYSVHCWGFTFFH